jgi:hypothetical protein
MVDHASRTAVAVLTDRKRFSFAYKARNTEDGPQVVLEGDVAPVAKLVAQDEDETREWIEDRTKTALVAADILREALAHH